jgi:hypothetical protein
MANQTRSDPGAPAHITRAMAALILVLALAARGAPVEAQFLVPLDFAQGALVDTEGGGAPYIGALRLQAALGIGTGAPLRVGPVVSVRYANPEWVPAAGARIQWLPLRFGLGQRRWGVGVAAEHLLAPRARDLSAAALIADLELIRLSAALVHERRAGRTGFELGLGTDLRSVAAVLFPRPDPPPFPDIP